MFRRYYDCGCSFFRYSLDVCKTIGMLSFQSKEKATTGTESAVYLYVNNERGSTSDASCLTKRGNG
jgi:hypothetical protein